MGVLRTLSSSSMSGPLSLGLSMSRVSYSRSRSSSTSGTCSAGSCSESRTYHEARHVRAGPGLGKGHLQDRQEEGRATERPPSAAPQSLSQALGQPLGTVTGPPPDPTDGAAHLDCKAGQVCAAVPLPPEAPCPTVPSGSPGHPEVTVPCAWRLPEHPTTGVTQHAAVSAVLLCLPAGAMTQRARSSEASVTASPHVDKLLPVTGRHPAAGLLAVWQLCF